MIPISKDENNQQAVPSAWRSTFVEIVEAFKENDYELTRGIEGVRAVSRERAESIQGNIEAYGAHLVSVPEESWRTSVPMWMLDYWQVMVDLYTSEEGASDLVLHMRVYEGNFGFGYEVMNVYVP